MEKLPNGIIPEDSPFAENVDETEARAEELKKAAEERARPKSMYEELHNLHQEEAAQTQLTEKQGAAEEFQGHPIVAPIMESATNEIVAAQPNNTETGAAQKTPEVVRQEAVAVQEIEAKAQGKLAKISAMMLERAAAGGKVALEATRHVGTKYQKLPFKTKMLITGTLLVGSLGSAAVGMGGATLAFSTAATLQRAFAGAATFTSTEALLYRAAQSIGGKDGAKREIGTKEGLAYLTTAAIAGLVVGVGLGNIGDALEKAKEVPGAIGGTAGNAKDYVAEKMSGLFGGETGAQEAVAATTPEAPKDINFTSPQEAAPAPTPTTSPEATIKSGDTLWKVLGSKLEESGKLEGLTEAQKAYVIDSIKDKLEAVQSMSPDKIKALGISSGNINTLTVGETLNLSSILQDNELVEKAVYRAGEIPSGAGAPIPPEAGSFTGAEEIPPQAGDFTGETAAPEVSADKNPQGWGPWEDPNDTTRTPEAAERAAAINATVETSVKSDMNELFGKKGFLGLFGKVSGLESPHMTHPQTGFGNMDVNTVLNSPSGPVNGVGTGVGMSNNEAHEKMLSYLANTQQETGVKPNSGETTLEYIKRAMGHSLAEQSTSVEHTPGQVLPQATEAAPVAPTVTPEAQPEIPPQAGSFTGETQVSPEATPKVEATAQVEAASVLDKDLQSKFTYSESGKITGISMSGSVSGSGESLLNQNWASTVRGSVNPSMQTFATQMVSAKATTIAGYENLLNTLESKGFGDSSEAKFLKETIEREITMTEKKYGDVFKN